MTRRADGVVEAVVLTTNPNVLAFAVSNYWIPLLECWIRHERWRNKDTRQRTVHVLLINEQRGEGYNYGGLEARRRC